MKLPYKESSVFLVPLGDGGYARGVVARAGKRGKVIFGYFFGPRLTRAEDATLHGLEPTNAILRIIFGDLGLINGEWRIIGSVPDWDRSQWPMPDFVRRDPLGYLKPVLVRHADDDPLQTETEYTIDDDIGMQEDLVAGYGAVEIRLIKLLGKPDKPKC